MHRARRLGAGRWRTTTRFVTSWSPDARRSPPLRQDSLTTAPNDAFPGLRREEVALLADISLDYYIRLERGNIRGASEGILGSLARALHLDDVERAHLFDLARHAPAPSARPRKPIRGQVRASVQRVLDNLTVPAVVNNMRQDLVGANLLGRALYTMHFDADRPSMARFIFLDRRAQDFYIDWPLARRLTAAMLRLQAGADPLNAEITALIGELSTRSHQFRKDWARQDVHAHSLAQRAPPPRGGTPRPNLRRLRDARRDP